MASFGLPNVNWSSVSTKFGIQSARRGTEDSGAAEAGYVFPIWVIRRLIFLMASLFRVALSTLSMNACLTSSKRVMRFL